MTEQAADLLPLPEHAFVPGSTPRHPDGFLDDILDLSPPVISEASCKDNPVLPYGLRLLRLKFYWECHEVLEHLWMRALANSREKHLLQGLIHIANAALKVKMGRTAAAGRIAVLASSAVDEAFQGASTDTLLGLNYGEVREAAHSCHRSEFSFQCVYAI